MDKKAKFRLSPQLLLGLMVMFLGVIFTLDNLDLIPSGEVLRYWPVALVLFGLYMVGEAQELPGRFTGGLIAVAGFLLLLESLGRLSFRIWDFWPLALVFVGFNLIWQALQRRGRPGDSNRTISGIGVLGGFNRTCNSPDFQGGELTAFMGGCEVDLRQASMEVDEAVIHTFAFWGGIEIRVPEDWTVTCKVFPFMGGVEEKTVAPETGPTKNLVIKGFAIMGGVEIHN